MPDIQVPSDTVLDEISGRGLKLLGAISSSSYIRDTLARRGYTDATHELGWSLVLEAAGYRRPAVEALQKPEAAAAIAELDAWDEPNFRVARAALVLFPEQRELVFQDLGPQIGSAAVASVATFLDRLDELESGKERKATRKADQAALDRLAERGIHKEERARLRKLLAVAMGSPDPGSAAPKMAADAEKQALKAAEQRDGKVALWAFWTEWSEVAKADIKRRDHLIHLGLAKRKAGKKGNEAGESTGDK